MSKLNRGASVGGFPGFEPLDGDDDYKKKIDEGNFNAQDVNDWIKDKNKHLKNITKYNPNMTLDEILLDAGYNDAQVVKYIEVLKNAYATAEGIKGYGVTEAIVETLVSVMSEPGVPIW